MYTPSLLLANTALVVGSKLASIAATNTAHASLPMRVVHPLCRDDPDGLVSMSGIPVSASALGIKPKSACVV